MTYIIPANPKYYDTNGAFDKFGEVDWRQGRVKYNIGDIIYIYQGSPLKRITHKTIVIEIDKDFVSIYDDKEFYHSNNDFENGKDRKYNRLKLIDTIDSDLLSFENLITNGLNGPIQGTLKLDNDDKVKLKNYIEMIFNNNDEYYPETAETNNCIEGAKKTIFVNKYERSTEARNKCIKYHGITCKVCGLNFKDMYGKLGEGFIHVHHIKPLSEIKEGYIVDPIQDLIPVCPNCHAMLHKKINGKTLSIEELITIINQ